MTTVARPPAPKPLADHGTTARAKGRPSSNVPGCGCPPCRAAENRYDKRRRYLNATGRTLNVPVEPIAAHLDTLFEAGAGWVQLAAASGVSNSVISRVRRRLQPTVRRGVANRLLAVQPGDAIPPGRPVPAIGSIRRVRALLALGHQCKDITAASGVEHAKIAELLAGHDTTTARHVAERIATGYTKLATTTGNSARSLNRAAREGWGPPVVWDDIDNPDAIPDWTGHCGSDRGWHVHQAERIPTCAACQTAHTQWLAERAHLAGGDRGRELFAARAAANTRGVTLAEDIRELLGRGYERQQVAERLQITRDVLQATLTRHPEPDAGQDEEVAA